MSTVWIMNIFDSTSIKCGEWMRKMETVKSKMMDIGDESIFYLDFDLVIYLLSAISPIAHLFRFILSECLNKHFAFPNNAKQNEIFSFFFFFVFLWTFTEEPNNRASIQIFCIHRIVHFCASGGEYRLVHSLQCAIRNVRACISFVYKNV